MLKDIDKYIDVYNELIEKSPYMEQGKIDYNNYNNISKSLKDNNFFYLGHEIILNNKDNKDRLVIDSDINLDTKIKEEKERVLNNQEIKSIFEQINKKMNKNQQTKDLSVFLQKHQEIIKEYKNKDEFKKKIWVKAFANHKNFLKDVLDEYEKARSDLKSLRDTASEDRTEWEEALKLFKSRFYVPFEIEISNQSDVILNDKLPIFKYIFTDVVNKEQKSVLKDSLLGTLSAGEARAYHILNMIFRILVAEKEKKEHIVVLDDISESFDYKNKYAIVEYINDMSERMDKDKKKLFKILILTHNFDFYRIVASRIASRDNAYIAYSDSGIIKFKKGEYIGNIFKNFKNKIYKEEKIFVASIPFVRNLIEYTLGTEEDDYLMLTNILHYKEDTRKIKVEDVCDIFDKHWLKDKPIKNINKSKDKFIYDIIIEEANKIEDIDNLCLKDRLILSMAIRLKAEQYIINELKKAEINNDEINKNQTRHLFNEYKKLVSDKCSTEEDFNVLKQLEQVVMMTPENIHLNSFMFEPILDMSLSALHKLYKSITKLCDK